MVNDSGSEVQAAGRVATCLDTLVGDEANAVA